MITTMEHPIAAMPRIAVQRPRAGLYLLTALVAGITLHGEMRLRTPAETVLVPVATKLGPLPSHNGALLGHVVEYPARIVIGEDQRWVVRLESRDGLPVQHARLSVIAYMPGTGQRGPSPLATPAGAPGEYELSGVRFDRAGWWNVALLVRYADGADSLAFNVSLTRAGSE
jgi:hypothetical protein